MDQVLEEEKMKTVRASLIIVVVFGGLIEAATIGFVNVTVDKAAYSSSYSIGLDVGATPTGSAMAIESVQVEHLPFGVGDFGLWELTLQSWGDWWAWGPQRINFGSDFSGLFRVTATDDLGGVTFTDDQKCVEFVGSGVCHAGITPEVDPPEVVLRIGVKDQDKAKVNRFGMEIVPLVTSGPPGVTGFAGGRPKATDIISYWPALIDKREVETNVRVETV